MPHPRRTFVPALLAYAFASVVTLSACADLPPIASDVCGNGVVDSHEDCDTFVDPSLGPNTHCGAPSDSTRACRYVCSQTQPCPGGWACGGDGICRYSAGTFVAAPGSPLAMTSDHIAAARFDHDPFPDLLGVSGPSVELRTGDAEGRFVASAQLSVDFPTGDFAIADLDQDKRSDLVLPLFDGLFVMRGGAQGTLDPVAYSATVVPPVDAGFQFFPWRLQDGYPFETELRLVGDCVLDRDHDVAQGCKEPLLTLPPGKLTRDLAGRLARADVQGGSAEELALAFAGDPYVYLYRVLDDDPSPTFFQPRGELYETIDVGAGVNAAYGVRFADVDGDGDLDLLASVGEDGADEVAVAYADGGHFVDANGQPDRATLDGFFDCVADSCACPDSGCEPGEHRRRWPMAIGALDGDKVADVVNLDGVFLRRGSGYELALNATSPAPWASAEIADFNRDGIPDVAVASEMLRGVDFFIGAGNGYFNPTHVDTTDVPLVLRPGDFDGDLVTDLAIGERGFSPGRDDDTVSVLFGRVQGAPLPPVSMGHLRRIEYMEPARLDDYPLDQIADLLVQSNGGSAGSARSLARLVGSAQRRLISPFRLPTPDGNFDYPNGVLVGHFAGTDAIPDLLAPGTHTLWVVKGTGDARFDVDDTHAIALGPPLFGIGAGQLGDDGYCDLWAKADLDGDGADEIIAVDHRGDLCGYGPIDAAQLRSRLLVARVKRGTSLTGSVVDLPAGRLGPRQLLLADIDADGHVDLVVVFGGLADQSLPGFVPDWGVTVFWGQDGGFDVAAPTSVEGLPENALPLSTATLNADADPELELAVATTSGIYLVDATPGAHTLGTPARVVAQPARDVVASDVNTDGLGDLIFSDLGGTQVFVYTAEPSLATGRAK